MKEVIVILSPEAEEVYKYLNQESQNSKIERTIFNGIKQKVNLIKQNPHYGNPISKNLIPKEYIKKYDTRKIGIHSQADFIVESLDGFTDLIELKKSDISLFEKDNDRNINYPSQSLSQVIGQAIHYIKTMEDHRTVLKENDDLEVLKPRIKIVIGRSNKLLYDEKKALRLLNSTLHGIEIITYDEILIRAKKIIDAYEFNTKN